MGTTLQRMPGRVQEGSLALGCGLRRKSYLAMVFTNTTGISASALASENTGAVWTERIIANGRVNYPSTLCVTVVQNSVFIGGTLRFRVRGLDYFGNLVEEITPEIPAPPSQLNGHIYLSQVFSVVYSFDYQSNGVSDHNIALGVRFDWTRTNDATNLHIAGLNLGIGIPQQMRFTPLGTVSSNGLGTDRSHQRQLWPPRRGAVNTLTTGDNPSAAETVTIDAVVYTFRAALVGAYDVLIGATEADTIQNLKDAINRTGTAGTQYHAGTAAHPTVFCSGSTATTLTITARSDGAEGIIITTTEGLTGGWTTATMSFGASDICEVGQVVIRDIGAVTTGAGSSTLEIPLFNYTIGYSVPGWHGCIEKLSIMQTGASAVGNYVTGDRGIVTMNLLTQERIY